MTVRQRESFMRPGGVAKAEGIIFLLPFPPPMWGARIFGTLIRRASNLRVSSPTTTMSGVGTRFVSYYWPKNRLYNA